MRKSFGAKQAAGSPAWLAGPAALALLFLLIPFGALVMRVHWGQIPQLLATTESQDALWLSLQTCLISTALCIVFGVPLALWLAQARNTFFPRLVRTIVTLPMVLPPVVAGLVLLITWGRMGILGSKLDLLGIQIGFTTLAVVIAQTFVAMPFLITSLEGALRTRGFQYEAAARGLGASRTRTLLQVTLPLSAPAIVSATALAFSRCLGEFGATITFAGSLQGISRTLPLEVYLQRETDTDLALSLSLVIIALAIVMVGGTQVLSDYWYSRLMGRHQQNATTGTVGAISGLSKKKKPEKPAGPGVHLDAKIAVRHLDVDLDFAPGSATALLGPNGAGKSTIISLLAGTLVPDSGSLKWSVDEPRIVLLAQDPALFPHMSVLRNVVFGLRCLGIDTDRVERLARTQLAAVGMQTLERRRPNQLSGGQKQRVAIARAMAIEPDVVLLDEPMASLDVEVADQLRLLLRERIGGATTIQVTHDLTDVIALDCQVVVLKRGQVTQRGYWRDLFEETQDRFLQQLTRKAQLDNVIK
ncbi:ABC transporter permease [Varibaculum cambriense]|uniref:ABC transporter permease n=1 Tax=Varibaculum cambriense TaxID=184870 RepID=UPI0029068E1A|nr:ABC transporter permease [Varibaculum cambriense]MDU3274611.1 ABC transporter permease [Varibaculum cambriense]